MIILSMLNQFAVVAFTEIEIMLILWLHPNLILRRRVEVETEVLAVEVLPGWKKGTKITFPNKGNKLCMAS